MIFFSRNIPPSHFSALADPGILCLNRQRWIVAVWFLFYEWKFKGIRAISWENMILAYEPPHQKTNNLHICKNKGADQLHVNWEAGQCLCFRYTDSTILLLKSDISSFYPSSVTVQAGSCQTWSETQIVGFLMRRLICEKRYKSANG